MPGVQPQCPTVLMENAPSKNTRPPEVHPTKSVTRQPGRHKNIKWPKAKDWVAWLNLITDLNQILELAFRGNSTSLGIPFLRHAERSSTSH